MDRKVTATWSHSSSKHCEVDFELKDEQLAAIKAFAQNVLIA